MTTWNKRLTLLAICATLCSLTMTGCDGGDEANKPEPPQPQGTLPPPPPGAPQ